ncbi:MAG: AI-2E family transporter [Candidatus Sericytochromatia bacterium]
MSNRQGTPPEGRSKRSILLVAILVLLTVGALKVSAPVTMPLAFALVLIVLAWPLQHRLERVMPRWAAFALTLIALLAIAGVFVGSLVYSLETVAAKTPQYADRLRGLADQVTTWARERHVPLPPDLAERVRSGVLGRVLHLFGPVTDFFGGLVVVTALLVLGLLEVGDYRRKLEARFSDAASRRMLEMAESIARKFRRFMAAIVVTCLLTGLLTSLWCWVAGIDFAIAWGVSAFLLNFVPTLGSIASVTAITLFAALQLQSIPWAIATFVVLAAMQLTLGSFVDPKVQGRFVSLSPFMVLFSVVFWGWLWGIPGALIAVPMTVALVAAASEFPRARWIAELLTEADRDEEDQA